MNNTALITTPYHLPPYITPGEPPRHIRSAERNAHQEALQALQQQLRDIQVVLSIPLPQDDLTTQIREWHNDLVAACNDHDIGNEELNAYIEDMQEILRNPITGAPLGLYPLQGNDGYAYGQLPLAIHRLVLNVQRQYTPQETRDDLSPITPETDVRFATGPHIVAHYMLLWLQKHNAILMSKELEDAYLRFAPQHQALTEEERVELFLADAKALDEAEAAQRNRKERELQQTLDRLARENREEFASLTAATKTISEPLQAPHKEINASLESQQREIDRVRDKVEQFMPQIEAFARETITRLQQTGQRDLALINLLDEITATLDSEIDGLNRHHEELKQNLQTATFTLSELEQNERKLNEAIARVKDKRKKRKKTRIVKIIKAVASVAISITAAYLLQPYGIGVSATSGANNSSTLKASFELLKF